MTQVRIDPFGICAAAGAPTGAATVTARLDLTSTDKCPICKKPMLPILAAKIPSYLCWEHRVVLPQPNPEVGSDTTVSDPTSPTTRPMPTTDGDAQTVFQVTQEQPAVPVKRIRLFTMRSDRR